MDIREGLTAVLVLAPFGGAILCAVLGAGRAIRSTIVLSTGVVLIASALWLIPLVPFRLPAESLLGLNLHTLIRGADAILLLIILYYGFKHPCSSCSRVTLNFSCCRGHHPPSGCSATICRS